MLARFFHREGSQDREVEVGRALWSGSTVDLAESPDAPEGTRDAIARIFRPVPIVVDDPSLRSFGTGGPSVLEPGDLRWFLSAAESRAEAEGLSVRLAPSVGQGMGWDPAGAYRTFTESVERRDSIAVDVARDEPEAGEARPEGERGPSAPGTEAARPGPAPSAAGHREDPSNR